LQSKVEETAARLENELKTAEHLKATAEANIAALQKQVCIFGGEGSVACDSAFIHVWLMDA
jgi:hypothetical protein